MRQSLVEECEIVEGHAEALREHQQLLAALFSFLPNVSHYSVYFFMTMHAL